MRHLRIQKNGNTTKIRKKVRSSPTGLFLMNMQCSIQWNSNHSVKNKSQWAVRLLFRALHGHLFKVSAEYHMQSKTQQAESGPTTKPCEVQKDVTLIPHLRPQPDAPGSTEPAVLRLPRASCARPPRDHPAGLPPLSCWESESKTGTFSRTNRIWGCRVAAFYFCPTKWAIWRGVGSLTLQPARKVKSWVKLHGIYETPQGRKSITSHLEPLFMVSYTKPLPLPGSSSVLCSPKHYMVKLSPTKNKLQFFYILLLRWYTSTLTSYVTIIQPLSQITQYLTFGYTSSFQSSQQKRRTLIFFQYHQKIQPPSFSATLGLSCLDLNHKNVRSSQVGKKGCKEKTKLYL